jgi:hypothetical protein
VQQSVGDDGMVMAIMADDVDMLLVCRLGMTLRTRDRREVLIESVSPADGLIFGQVRMHGACVWRSDGCYRDAPFGAAGPLDLVLVPVETSAPGPRKASIKEALAEDSRFYCCD